MASRDIIQNDVGGLDMQQQFVPLRRKQKRASTGAEDNFVSSYMPRNLVPDAEPSQDRFEWGSIYMTSYATPTNS